nr:odorant-binding protein 8 [Plautia stali]
MLYLQLLLVVGVLSAQSVLSMTFEEAVAVCSKTLGIDADTEKMNFKDPAFPEQMKCAVACVLEKKDVIKGDGSIDKKKDRELLDEVITDENLKKKYFKALDECDVAVKPNKCELAYEFIICKKTKVGVI